MSSRVVYFLNGPNANLYGLDAKGVYGTESFPRSRRVPRTRGRRDWRSISGIRITRAC